MKTHVHDEPLVTRLERKLDDAFRMFDAERKERQRLQERLRELEGRRQ